MSLSWRKREARMGWVFVSPALLHLFVFALLPIGVAFAISLYKWQLFKQNAVFVALKNYAYAFTEPAFWNAMWNSFRYAVLAVPLGMAAALAVALLVNQKLRGVTIFRTSFYIPAISSGVAISMVWIYIYLPETGLINSMSRALRIDSVDFLTKSQWAMLALVFMSIWVGLGPRMVLFLAGLIGIPPSLYEAAELDGASRWRSFWSVTLPMLAPTTFFVLVTSTIGAMQIFTPVYMMTQGGPAAAGGIFQGYGSTDVVGYHIYSEAWVNFNTGLASAKSFVLLVVIAAISLFQFKLMKRQMEGYSTE